MPPETLPPDGDTHTIRVCLNCGNIWKSRNDVARAQCYKCRKTRSRPATAEEIAAYETGITNIHLLTPPGETPPPEEEPPEEVPGLTDDQMLDLLPGAEEQPETPTPAGGGIPPVAIAIGAVLLVGALAGCYFLFIRPKNRDMDDQEQDQVTE